MNKRLHALFSGRVQGVGFRYTAERLAHHFPVTGFVKNLPDGKVEVIAEGEEDMLKDFLKAIEDAFSGHIRKIDPQWQKATGEYRTFGIGF